MTRPDARAGRSLDGDWQVIVDPFDHGRIDYQSRPTEEFAAERVRTGPADRVEHEFSDQHTLSVPGDWNSQRDDLFYYEGAVWYRRTFDAPPAAGERAFLHFGGANRVARVWINGQFLGRHDLGFTPFEFEVTQHLRAGENAVVVSVDNRRAPDAVPGMMYDWWNYGGITRSVRLITVPETFVKTLHAGLDPLDPTRIAVRARIDGPDRGVPVRVEIPGLALSGAFTPGADGTVEAAFRVPDALERWSPERPMLYEVTLRAGTDTLSERVGFRTIETRGGDILLNGERVFLRGICIHEEAPDRPGRASGPKDAATLLGWAKDLGCNFVRLAHYPHNEAMARAADEMGLLVWAEVPVYWTLDYANPETLDQAKGHLREMVERDRSRASVIIWSVGNETGDAPERTEFRRALGAYAKELDPTRLLSAALFARQIRDEDGTLTRLHVDDPFGAVADVLSINEYVGWYHDQPEDILGVEVTLAWDKPFVISETGAGVKRGLRGDASEVWTEEFGVRFYEAQLAWAESVPLLDGISPWILKDFRSPRRPLYGVQDWYNRKGLIDETGQRKLVFDTVRSFYARWAEGGAAPNEKRP